VPLSPVTDAGARANLGIRLPFAQGDKAWDYYIEYVKPTYWDHGLTPNSFVFVRRTANVPGIGNTAAILGSIQVPTSQGTSAQFLEPTGNVRFEVQWLGSTDRILKVMAKKL